MQGKPLKVPTAFIEPSKRQAKTPKGFTEGETSTATSTSATAIVISTISTTPTPPPTPNKAKNHQKYPKLLPTATRS